MNKDLNKTLVAVFFVLFANLLLSVYLLDRCEQRVVRYKEVIVVTDTVYVEKQKPAVTTTTASWYGGIFHGRTMANGEVFDKNKLTAASPLIKGTSKPKYKLGTKLEVTNPKNNKSVIVEVTDTGGFQKYGRGLDLSKKAFATIANIDKGIITVNIRKCLEN